MRAFKFVALAAAAALSMGVVSADAHPFPHPIPGPHGFPHPGPHPGYGGGWGPWGGAGLAFGLAGAAIGAGIAAEDYCVSYVPVYDDWGNYIGRRPVNAC